MSAAVLLAFAMSASAYTSAWIAPFDKFSSADWACFDEIDVFAMAFDQRHRVFTAYPDLVRQSLEARPAGVPVIPVVVSDVWAANAKEPGELKSITLLNDRLGTGKKLDAHVDELAKAAEPFDGLELDYERIPAGLWENFTQLVEKLGDKLHAQGKKLGVDVEAGPLYSQGGAVAHKYWGRLGRAADKVKVMCYYEKGAFSDSVGPGSSTAFVEETGRRALAFVPADHLALALSLAATDWQVPLAALQSRRQVTRLHFRKARELQSQAGSRPLWDDLGGAPYFEYDKDGQKHEVYYEDERSLGAKIEAARRLGAGVSLWYLGETRPDLRAMGLCR